MPWIENVHTGRREEVTDAQKEVLDKLFRNQFKLISSPPAANFSEETTKIIEQANSPANDEQEESDSEE